MGLVLRQGTGLALSISILPPGCSQKKVASLMNTQEPLVVCFEVSEKGIRKVSVPPRVQQLGYEHWMGLDFARRHFLRTYRPAKPRVAPRMAVGVVIAQGVAHAHA